MDSTILQCYCNHNTTISKSVSKAEFLGFIHIELLLSVNGVSLSMFFDPNNQTEFPAASLGMDRHWYVSILEALMVNRKFFNLVLVPGKVFQSCAGTWQPPMAHNRESRKVVNEGFTKINLYYFRVVFMRC